MDKANLLKLVAHRLEIYFALARFSYKLAFILWSMSVIDNSAISTEVKKIKVG